MGWYFHNTIIWNRFMKKKAKSYVGLAPHMRWFQVKKNLEERNQILPLLIPWSYRDAFRENQQTHLDVNTFKSAPGLHASKMYPQLWNKQYHQCVHYILFPSFSNKQVHVRRRSCEINILMNCVFDSNLYVSVSYVFRYRRSESKGHCIENGFRLR